MAKISARGAHEVAKVRASQTFGEDKGPTTFLFALRSDGAILRRLVSYVDDNGAVQKVSGGYSIVAKGAKFAVNPAPMDAQHPLNVLSLYCERRGYVCEKAGR